ncbi:MAG: hypothetical protein EXR77_03740 [Myxococcales bacterium]|nr:hypothetical protein [Myxococcales bacterium]
MAVQGKTVEGGTALGTLFLAMAVACTVLSMGCQTPTADLRATYGPNKLPVADTGSTIDSAQELPTDGTVTGVPCDCLAKGQWFRFNTLKIKSLDGGPHLVVGTLNPIWQADIDNMELNFFLEVQDVSETEVRLSIINAARLDKAKNICTLANTESIVVMERVGCKLKNKLKTGLNVYAGTQANPKNCTTGLAIPHSIPVRNAFFEATVAQDCKAVTEGLLVEGAIARTALDGTCTCLTLGGKMAEECGVPSDKFVGYPSEKNEPGKPPAFCTECCKGCNDNYSNLNELLDSFGALKYGCKDEAGGPAVCLSATFTALTTTAPTPCK